MPEIKLPIDELFVVNFKARGGKFLYCDSLSDVFINYKNILDENNWEAKDILCNDHRLLDLFKEVDPNLSLLDNVNGACFLSTCEQLIAHDGSLLVSSNQIAEKKLKNLPVNFIIYATTSQILDTISEGLSSIKKKYKTRIPTNITSIKEYKKTEDNDFLSYGNSSKNLYLLLLEDL